MHVPRSLVDDHVGADTALPRYIDGRYNLHRIWERTDWLYADKYERAKRVRQSTDPSISPLPGTIPDNRVSGNAWILRQAAGARPGILIPLDETGARGRCAGPGSLARSSVPLVQRR